MWTIQRIDEVDYGCEERLPGEPLMALVTLENEIGELLSFEMPDNWLRIQELNEGDEWPEEITEENPETLKAKEQAEWMEHYYHALQELEGED